MTLTTFLEIKFQFFYWLQHMVNIDTSLTEVIQVNPLLVATHGHFLGS